ncbi:uncharacterized protein MYCFIDRAFT_205264 [Pseudocercospora fijiensis CIRAD86]|uniref:Uncharacterized protein n=1 Tax=Pseudocercospora fijiensis (strain CIRAD86) TaxID=383855 RepID=M2ZEZ8_PSEFD|nr:uncharacterized protein MYCFIDRAFT_205264 [Pseudocercospora fijiensis CIRAD86]EME77699.1 hypothetical protein MYCFIDRAFT_205264 [Pseudocercospora fijiensis CIRAD86]
MSGSKAAYRHAKKGNLPYPSQRVPVPWNRNKIPAADVHDVKIEIFPIVRSMRQRISNRWKKGQSAEILHDAAPGWLWGSKL